MSLSRISRTDHSGLGCDLIAMTGILIREKTQRSPREEGGRDWSDAATSQGTLEATRSWKMQGRILPRVPEGADFLVSEFWPPEL